MENVKKYYSCCFKHVILSSFICQMNILSYKQMFTKINSMESPYFGIKVDILTKNHWKMENFRKIIVTDLNMLFHHYYIPDVNFCHFNNFLSKLTIWKCLFFGVEGWHFDDKSLKNGIFRQITVTGLNILFHYLYLLEVHFVMRLRLPKSNPWKVLIFGVKVDILSKNRWKLENCRQIIVTDLKMLFHHYLYNKCAFWSYKRVFIKINTIGSPYFGDKSWHFDEKSLKNGKFQKD